MSKVAVYWNQHGPAAVFTLPSGNSDPPQHAYIPGGPFRRALSQFSAKGSELTWEEWADHLAGKLPYFDSWSVEEVPEGYGARQALSWVRYQESRKISSPAS